MNKSLLPGQRGPERSEWAVLLRSTRWCPNNRLAALPVNLHDRLYACVVTNIIVDFATRCEITGRNQLVDCADKFLWAPKAIKELVLHHIAYHPLNQHTTAYSFYSTTRTQPQNGSRKRNRCCLRPAGFPGHGVCPSQAVQRPKAAIHPLQHPHHLQPAWRARQGP